MFWNTDIKGMKQMRSMKNKDTQRDLRKGNPEGMEKTLMKTDRRWREPETTAKMEIRRHSCNYSFDPPTT